MQGNCAASVLSNVRVKEILGDNHRVGIEGCNRSAFPRRSRIIREQVAFNHDVLGSPHKQPTALVINSLLIVNDRVSNHDAFLMIISTENNGAPGKAPATSVAAGAVGVADDIALDQRSAEVHVNAV